uniref:EamA domain-containing protein n=1 Tax=viral metagenome TaxID=1070528 RepID=A0A6C0BTQ6_9ZZZZ
MKYQLIIGAVLALLDTVSLPLLKTAYITNNHFFLSLGVVIGVVQKLIFYNSMKYTTLTVLNVLWDLLSDVFVSLVGIFIFRESITTTKLVGIALSFVSIYLLNA